MSRRGGRRRSGRAAAGDPARQRTPPGVWDQIETTARAAPDRVALVAAGGRLGYGDLVRATAAAADRLAPRATAAGPDAERSVEQGRVTGLLAGPSIDGVVGLLAALRAGVVVAPLDPRRAPAELRRQVARAGVDGLIAGTGGDLVAAAVGLPVLLAADLTGLTDRSESLDGPDARDLPPPTAPPPSSADAVVLVHPADGDPRVVVHDHASLAAATRAAGLEVAVGEPVVVAAPLHAAATLPTLLSLLVAGCEVHLVDPSTGDPDALVAAVSSAGATVVTGPPPLHRDLVVGAERRGAPPSVRAVVIDGLGVTTDDVGRHRAVFGDRVALVCRWSAPDVLAVADADLGGGAWSGTAAPLGRSLPGRTVELVDVDPATGIGQVEVVAAALGRRSDGDPEGSAPVVAVAADGRRTVRTGELGRRRDDGSIEWCGRADDLVVVNGVRVHLGDVRTALAALPGVVAADAVVDGRRLRGFVRSAPGAAPLDVGGFRGALAQVLPLAAVPSTIEEIREVDRAPGPSAPAPTAVPAAERVDTAASAPTPAGPAPAGPSPVGPAPAAVGSGAAPTAAPGDPPPRRGVVRLGCLEVRDDGAAGAAVLLVPGVAAPPGELSGLASALVDRGHCVVVADLRPAAGRRAASASWAACRIVADLGRRPGAGPVTSDGLTVVGHSLGCAVALEVALRLADSGRDVPLLALVDPPLDAAGAPGRDRRRRRDAASRALVDGDVRTAVVAAASLAVEPLAPVLLAAADRVPALADHRGGLARAVGVRAAARAAGGRWAGASLVAWSTGTPGGGRGEWEPRLVGAVDEVTIGAAEGSALDTVHLDDLVRVLGHAVDRTHGRGAGRDVGRAARRG